MTETGRAPAQYRLPLAFAGAAAAVTATQMLGEVTDNGDVSGVSYAPNAAITGVNTNTRLLRIINRGQDGTGATIVAELQFNAGVNAAAGDEVAMTLQAAANLEVNPGDILALESAAVGTGLADPGGLCQVEYTRE